MHLAESDRDLKATSISAAEFLYGARISTRPDIVDVARRFLAHFPILPFDAGCAFIYADIAARQRDTGNRISSFDELIAAIVLRHDDEIVSRDRHFAAISGLNVRPY